MANRLIDAHSPYLLQHALNPVNWYPWGPEALEKARAENKPIFLSIGYSACHWCHVMAHETFEDPRTAALMNQYYVSIKVDREERPDLDSIYMQATVALTGSGGWPMSLFLTPDLRPFYAGTYFPPAPRHGMPGFSDVLQAVASMWRENPSEIGEAAARVNQQINAASGVALGSDFSEESLDTATRSLLDFYDWEHGGWGAAPKFPQPMVIDYLMRRSLLDHPGYDSLTAAVHALRTMTRGGMYDVVGGGFSRYSTDASWHVPHFEKMLYDNAQLARTYLHAWQITLEPYFERTLSETLDFVERELTSPDGGFYSSLDADSDGQEGAYYVWTKEQIEAALANPDDSSLFVSAYGISDRGNWDGRWVLQRALDDASLAARFHVKPTEVADRLRASHARLLSTRARRSRPTTDDKMLTSWNALMLRTYAEAAVSVEDISRRQRYLEAATRNARFLLSELRPGGDLRHTWRQGSPGTEVFLEDFAGVILALLQLYQADFDARWYGTALELADEMLKRFSDPAGGFFDTPKDAELLLLRPKELQDSATPCGNALAAEALLLLAALGRDSAYIDCALSTLRLVANLAPRYPTSFGHWLSAADLAVRGCQQVAVVFPPGATIQPFLDTIRNMYRPNLVLAASEFPPRQDVPALLQDREPISLSATAFVCQDFVCKLAVTSPSQLARLL